MTRSAYLLKVVAGILLIAFPVVLFAADPGPAAMLYAHGTTMLNGTSVPRSIALFTGDFVQTNADSVANINSTGSTVLIMNSSFVQYEDNGVKLEHGGMKVSTSKQLVTHVGDVTVTPATGVWTEFEVRDVDGKVQIVAQKGDLTVSDSKGTATLAEGQQTDRDETQGQESRRDRKRGGGATPAARGGVLNSPVAIGIATGVATGLGVWAIVQGDEPASPSR